MLLYAVLCCVGLFAVFVVASVVCVRFMCRVVLLWCVWCVVCVCLLCSVCVSVCGLCGG